MTLPLPFDLLALAILAAWLPTLRLGEQRVPPWTAVFVVAVIAGASVGVLTWSALGTLAALGTFAWAGHTAPRRRPLYVALAALLSLAMSLHWMRGFHNPVQFAGVRLTPDSLPLTQHLNFDKGAAGLVLLAAFGARSASLRGFARQWPTIVAGALATAALAIGLALALSDVRFEPKLPDGAQAFLVTNLFFTCVAEEAFFRGLIQERLMRLADTRGQPAWTAIAVVVSALLFGLAHAGGGATWMLIATVAGFGYAAVYARTRTLEGPILVHFGVNAVHFLFFTYPALAS